MDTQRPERHCDLSAVPGEGLLGPTFPEVFSLLSFHGAAPPWVPQVSELASTAGPCCGRSCPG